MTLEKDYHVAHVVLESDNFCLSLIGIELTRRRACQDYSDYSSSAPLWNGMLRRGLCERNQTTCQVMLYGFLPLL